MPLPASKRQSGFLTPSYINTSKLGAGIALPYYSNIAPNKDLITTIQYHPSGGHALLDNKYRHLLENGQYEVDLEIANNRPKTNNLIGTANREIDKEFRFYGTASGNFSFSEETALDFNIDHVGDKNYLRDYQNGFVGHKVSTINLDYIKDQDYASIKLVETQELEIDRDETTAPMALPIINYVKTIKPKNSSLNETYKLLFNSTFITRENGLQYRRLSTKPEIRVPYNLNGNLFEIGANIQGDFYNMENNSKHSQPDNNFKSTAFNYRPEADLKWSLPMVGKYKTNTIIIEPLARITIGTFKNNSDEIPNEDSQDIELTQSNLFLSDRFTGFDRNESGTRASYGFKSSLFNDVIGKFNFALGQSWRENSKTQDVVIRGFDEKKSNIVGEFGYDFFNNFSLRYNFHLNESSYRNDVNDFSANLNLGRLSLNGDYIFISKTDSTLEARKQIRAGARFNVTDKFSLNFENTQDLVNSRTITRRYGLLYDGCCVSYSFVVAEDNPIISSKAQKSFSINFVIKNL
jgi:LPS-assembly protein